MRSRKTWGESTAVARSRTEPRKATLMMQRPRSASRSSSSRASEETDQGSLLQNVGFALGGHAVDSEQFTRRPAVGRENIGRVEPVRANVW